MIARPKSSSEPVMPWLSPTVPNADAVSNSIARNGPFCVASSRNRLVTMTNRLMVSSAMTLST